MTDASSPFRWEADYDVLDQEYVTNPYPIWDHLRSQCPVAHTERWGESWMLTRYSDVMSAVRDHRTYSSSLPDALSVVPLPEQPKRRPTPPITMAPPEHGVYRRMILPRFAPRAVKEMEPLTRQRARSLVDGFLDAGRVDVSAEYAQEIPVWVIAQLLGVPVERSDVFTHAAHHIFSPDPAERGQAMDDIDKVLNEQISSALTNPGDDIIGDLVAVRLDGEPLSLETLLGMTQVLLIAGIDTTEAVIAASLWHLAQNDHDRRRLVSDASLIPGAVEEFLRAFAPVTIGRRAAEEVELGNETVPVGGRVLLSFPAANRDPEVFERANEVIIDREVNPHIAFGAGIHRCAGSHLARMELVVALEEWLSSIPDFELEDPSAVRWAGGTVRAPRTLNIAFPARTSR
jgi:cytochrome P450